jgi:acyl-CoA dehydrogenase
VDLARAAFRPDAAPRAHTPLEHVERKGDGLSVFLVDLREALGRGPEAQPIRTMMNHETNELSFERLEIPAESLVGEAGRRAAFPTA